VKQYSLQYTDVTGLENGPLVYVITNQVEVVAGGSREFSTSPQGVITPNFRTTPPDSSPDTPNSSH